LEDLLRQLTIYQLNVAEEIAAVSASFQRDVLTSILFDKEFDTWVRAGEAVDLGKQQEELTKAYKELGALTAGVQQRIAAHFEAIGKSIDAVQRSEEGSTMLVNDILPLPLLRRTQHIIKLLSEADAKKQEINLPINSYIAALEAFIDDKKGRISPQGELVATKGDRLISVPHLSSGEKQLVVLLTEALLQRGQPYVFLADEPELSLHIEWQEKIIASLRALNPKAQVVVATHSPEIAAGWKSRLIDMAEVVRG